MVVHGDALKTSIAQLQCFVDIAHLEGNRKNNILHNSWAQDLTITEAGHLSATMVMDIS